MNLPRRSRAAQQSPPPHSRWSAHEGEHGGRLRDCSVRSWDLLRCLRGAFPRYYGESSRVRFGAIAQSVAPLRSTAEAVLAAQTMGRLSMMMFGVMFGARRSLPIAVDYSDKSHHPFVFVTQDVAVKDEFARDVFAKAHQQAHFARRHRLVWRPVRIRQSDWHVDRVQHPAFDKFVVTFEHAEMQLMNV